MEERKVLIDEKLWSAGREFGTVKMLIQARQIPYIRQTLVGVMTNNGIHKSSPSVYFRDITIDSDVQKTKKVYHLWGFKSIFETQIKQLAEAKNQLLENVYKLHGNEKAVSGFERLKLKEEMLNHFNRAAALAQKTHKVCALETKTRT